MPSLLSLPFVPRFRNLPYCLSHVFFGGVVDGLGVSPDVASLTRLPRESGEVMRTFPPSSSNARLAGSSDASSEPMMHVGGLGGILPPPPWPSLRWPWFRPPRALPLPSPPPPTLGLSDSALVKELVDFERRWKPDRTGFHRRGPLIVPLSTPLLSPEADDEWTRRTSGTRRGDAQSRAAARSAPTDLPCC